MMVVYMFCCRWWPIAAGFPVGRCGYCNERPRLREVA